MSKFHIGISVEEATSYPVQKNLSKNLSLLYDATSLSAFKSSLGTFLDKVPDIPPIGQSGVNNNSLLDWARKNFQN